MGAILSSHFHRTVFAVLIYIVDIVQFVGALVIIQPWLNISDGGKTDTPAHLCGSSAGILVAGVIGFTVLAFLGQVILHTENENTNTVSSDAITKLVSETEGGTAQAHEVPHSNEVELKPLNTV